MSTSNTASLTAQLDAQKQAFLNQVPDEVKQRMADSLEDLIRTGTGQNALRAGQPAPDFTLPDVTGQRLRLTDCLREGPVVLSFYRGGWCPYCNLELRALQQTLPALQARGARLIAVTPESPDHTAETVREAGLDYSVLTDQHDVVAQQYGLVFTLPESLRPLYAQWGIDLPGRNGDDSYSLPIPATYVIDRDATVRAAFVDVDYTRRMEPAAILAALDALNGAHHHDPV